MEFKNLEEYCLRSFVIILRVYEFHWYLGRINNFVLFFSYDKLKYSINIR